MFFLKSDLSDLSVEPKECGKKLLQVFPAKLYFRKKSYFSTVMVFSKSQARRMASSVVRMSFLPI